MRLGELLVERVSFLAVGVVGAGGSRYTSGVLVGDVAGWHQVHVAIGVVGTGSSRHICRVATSHWDRCSIRSKSGNDAVVAVGVVRAQCGVQASRIAVLGSGNQYDGSDHKQFGVHGGVWS